MERPQGFLKSAIKNSVLILFSVILFFRPDAPSLALAAPALVLEPSRDSYAFVGPLLEILVDPARTWTFQQVTSPPLVQEFTRTGKMINLGITRDAVWLRFTVKNRRPEGPGGWVLDLDIPPMIRADLYWPDETGVTTCTRGGTSVPLSGKTIRCRGHAFPVQIPPGAEKTGYLYLSSEETLVVDLSLMTPEAFRNKERSEMNLFLVIAGVFLTVAFSNLMIYLFTRDATYLYFLLFIVSFAAFLASNFGLAALFLWPESPAAARLASPLASGLAQFWGMLFCRKFVGTKIRLPKVDRCFVAAILLAGLSVPVTLVDSFAGNLFVGTLSLLVFSLAMIACLARLKSRNEPARLFIAAMAVAMIGGFLSWLMVFGYLGFNLFTFGLGPLALIAGTVLFLFSLGTRLFVFESNYRRIFDGVNDPIYLYCPETRSFGEVNQRACDCYGYSRAEWTKLKIEDLIDTSAGSDLSAEALRARMDRALEDTPQLVQAVNRRKNGERFWGELNLVRTTLAKQGWLLVVTRDISDHKRLEHELQNAYQTWQRTFDAMRDAVTVLDPEGVVVLSNRTMGTLMNRKPEEMIGRPCWEIVHGTSGPVEDCPLERMKRTGQRETMALTVGERHLEVTVDPLLDREGSLSGSIHILSDVTTRKKMEEELLRAQKLESVGVLAGGIAHDFNNILMVIWGNVSLARMSAPPDSPVHNPLEQAEIASKRARDLSQQLLTFARGGAPVKKPSTLGKLCREAIAFALSGSSSTCVFEGKEDPWWAEVDEGQINQVFYNIALNAVQAMPEGGQLRIQGRTLDLEEKDGLPLKPGRYVEFLLQDEGIGIRQEHIERIFDPYFTTKQTGSGLGLAIAHSIVSRHGGHIRVSSLPGRGAAFRLYFPLMKNPPVAEEEEERVKPVLGKGNVLLMDDDPMVRDVAGNILSHLGYDVVSARDGGEALDLYRKAMGSARPFDVVILDLTVPGGMGGGETMKKLLEIDPGVRGIVSSGFFSDPIMADPRSHGFVAVIAKPYTIQALSTLLKEIIH
jgi:PAS domain S-box-containing protein